MKNFRLFAIAFPAFISFFANAKPAADSVHVKSYTIYIDSINYAAQSVRGSCVVNAFSKVAGLNNIRLSLLQMNIDSVLSDNVALNYSYDDTTIVIQTPSLLSANDSLVLRIYYHGNPKKDASGWGGFYFSGTYAFNLGVGFAADPHSFGRAWFPCIDEFDDKSYYDFFITTAPAYKAFCNGILAGSQVNINGTITWHWQMNQPIPAYLACMAVSNYYTLERISNNIPVTWACAASDTTAVLNTFQHLDTVLSTFINSYGPYPFDKAGYNLVPFSSGAMEHATAITIGKPFIDGTLTYETLWAHELSHMWWGDKVTCATPGDMWLNEGFASYNEALITEKIYGTTAYKNWIRTNHRKVLQFAHIEDGSYLSFYNVPHQYTYGTTVYNKGADVIHTLKNFMGENNFFDGCKLYMNNHAYGNADSYDLRNDLATSSGTDMTRFFDDWIFTPGFPHFSIDSVIYVPGGLDHYYVYVRQRSKGNNHIYSMPVEISFTDGIFDSVYTVIIDSATQSFHFAMVMNDPMVTIDRNEKISDAITDYERWIKTTGLNIFPETGVLVNVLNAGVDSSLLRIEHNWVQPDDWKTSNPGIRVSDYHYWRIDGLIKPGFVAQGTFTYNGSNNPTTGHIDNSLITGTEDSLVMLWRSGVSDDWSLVTALTFLPGSSHNDKIGSFRVDTLKKGEYVLGYRDQLVNVNTNEQPGISLSASPNPSKDSFNIEFGLGIYQKGMLVINDATGKQVFSKAVRKNDTSYRWNAKDYSPGLYIVKLVIDNKTANSYKIMLAR